MRVGGVAVDRGYVETLRGAAMESGHWLAMRSRQARGVVLHGAQPATRRVTYALELVADALEFCLLCAAAKACRVAGPTVLRAAGMLRNTNVPV